MGGIFVWKFQFTALDEKGIHSMLGVHGFSGRYIVHVQLYHDI